MVPFLGRVVLLAVVSALAVAAAGGGDAFWLSVPLALLVAAPAEGRVEAALGAGCVVLAAAAPALLGGAGFGPLPGVPLVVVVVGGSMAVLMAVRARLEGERSAMRHWALSDPLTGAANRRGLAERMICSRVEPARGAL